MATVRKNSKLGQTDVEDRRKPVVWEGGAVEIRDECVSQKRASDGVTSSKANPRRSADEAEGWEFLGREVLFSTYSWRNLCNLCVSSVA